MSHQVAALLRERPHFALPWCVCLQLLPFCGAFSARIIHQLLASGTCDPLERYRANQVRLNFLNFQNFEFKGAAGIWHLRPTGEVQGQPGTAVVGFDFITVDHLSFEFDLRIFNSKVLRASGTCGEVHGQPGDTCAAAGREGPCHTSQGVRFSPQCAIE